MKQNLNKLHMIQSIIHMNNSKFETSLKYELEAEPDNQTQANISYKPELMRANHK